MVARFLEPLKLRPPCLEPSPMESTLVVSQTHKVQQNSHPGGVPPAMLRFSACRASGRLADHHALSSLGLAHDVLQSFPLTQNKGRLRKRKQFSVAVAGRAYLLYGFFGKASLSATRAVRVSRAKHWPKKQNLPTKTEAAAMASRHIPRRVSL